MPRGVSFFRWQTVQDAHEPGEETVRRFLRQSSQYVFFVAALFAAALSDLCRIRTYAKAYQHYLLRSATIFARRFLLW
jgi:hypothetical protein